MDLSAFSNLVNAVGLGLTGTSISGNTVAVHLSATRLSAAAPISIRTAARRTASAPPNGQVSVTVQGDADGLTGNDIVQPVELGSRAARVDRF